MVAPAKLQRQLKAYIQQYCPEGWQAMQRGRRATALPQLTHAEKAAIYFYTDEGYEALNRGLHATGGRLTSIMEQGLAAALAKLPPYEGEVISGVRLTPAQLQQYRACLQSEQPVSWPAFLSASQRIGIARQYLHNGKNCLFVIQSRTGRPIEEVSKFGVNGQNEHEVLFAPNTQFEVLGIEDEPDHVRISLYEL